MCRLFILSPRSSPYPYPFCVDSPPVLRCRPDLGHFSLTPSADCPLRQLPRISIIASVSLRSPSHAASSASDMCTFDAAGSATVRFRCKQSSCLSPTVGRQRIPSDLLLALSFRTLLPPLPSFPLSPPCQVVSLPSRGNPFLASTRSTPPPQLCHIRVGGSIVLPSPVPSSAS